MESQRSGFKEKIIYGGITTILLLIGIFIGHKFFQSSDRNDVRVVYSLDKMQNDQEIINVINGAQKYIYFAIYTVK